MGKFIVYQNWWLVVCSLLFIWLLDVRIVCRRWQMRRCCRQFGLSQAMMSALTA